MARTFGHFSPAERERFIEALKSQADWEERLLELQALADVLQEEGRYETAFWKNRT